MQFSEFWLSTNTTDADCQLYGHLEEFAIISGVQIVLFTLQS